MIWSKCALRYRWGALVNHPLYPAHVLLTVQPHKIDLIPHTRDMESLQQSLSIASDQTVSHNRPKSNQLVVPICVAQDADHSCTMLEGEKQHLYTLTAHWRKTLKAIGCMVLSYHLNTQDRENMAFPLQRCFSSPLPALSPLRLQSASLPHHPLYPVALSSKHHTSQTLGSQDLTCSRFSLPFPPLESRVNHAMHRASLCVPNTRFASPHFGSGQTSRE